MSSLPEFNWKKAFRPEESKFVNKIEENDTIVDTLESLKDAINEFYGEDISDLSPIKTVCTRIQELYSDLLNNRIPEAIFIRFTKLVERNLFQFYETHMQVEDIPTLNFNIQKILKINKVFIDSISNICNPETQQIPKWSMKPYVPSQAIQFNEICDLFSTYVSLISDVEELLDPEELESLHISSLKEQLSTLTPTSLIQQNTRFAKSRFYVFDTQLLQVEKVAASKLHVELMTKTNAPESILQVFKQHSALISQKAVIQELGHEFSTVQTFIQAQTQKMIEEISKLSNSDAHIDNVIWFKQRKGRLENYRKFCLTMYQQISPDLQQVIQQATTDLEAFGKREYQQWVFWVKNHLDSLKVPDDGKLIDFHTQGDGLIEVKFSDDLYQFMDDIRRLSAAKFTIKPNLMDIYKKAEPYAKQALIMQRVAMFYNTMDERIIPCQLTMLENQALQFEKLVKLTKNLNPNSAPQTLLKLQNSLNEIMDANSYLGQEHHNLIKEILNLFKIDLVDKKQQWNQTIKTLREKVRYVTSQGFTSPENWMEFLDVQIYKALRYQFRASLLQISERTAQIEILMVFVDNKLQYRPNIDEVRRMYYQSVQDLLIYPKSFRGLSSQQSILDMFADISNIASDVLFYVYDKGETLMREVADYRNQFYEWMVLAENLDKIEAKCTECISTASDWKSNLSLVAMRKQSINKIEDTKFVGCFKIDNTQAKEGFRRLLSQFQSILLQALRKTLQDEFDNVNNFVNGGLELMNSKFDTTESISEAHKKCEELVRSKVEIELTFTSLQEKVRLLKSFESIDKETAAFNQLQENWKILSTKIEEFDDKMAEQTENIRKKMQEDFGQLKANVHNFKLLWDETKPKNINYDNESIDVTIPETLNKFQTQFNELKEQYTKLEKTLKAFDENCELTELDEISDELAEQFKSMELIKEWRTTFTEIATQKWETASSKIFAFEDFLTSWNSKISDNSSDAALYVGQKVSMYKGITPYLKFARGDDWCQEHWIQFFKMVGINSSINPKDLLLRDLLEVGDKISSNMQALKELSDRARGEATIRTSLEEIRSWFSTNNFQWFNHVFAGRSTYIVKEWKNLLSDLADKQSLINSLKDSPFIKAFKNDADLWSIKADSLAVSLYHLSDIQRRWLHLEPVFVKKALPEHQATFGKVDSEFREIMSNLRATHRASSAADCNHEQLKKMQSTLENLNRALNAFLEQKRNKFSRFYFIGDEDLLEIIGQASEDVTIVQAHLKKLFQGVAKVRFDESNKKIISIVSSLGEIVQLKKPVSCEGNVEDWLMELSTQIVETLKAILCDMMNLDTIDNYKYPSMLTLLWHQIKFTEKLTAIYNSNVKNSNGKQSSPVDLKPLKQFVEKSLNELVSEDSSTELERYVVRSLIIEYVRFRSVIEEITTMTRWEMKKQLLFYFRDGLAYAEMGDAIIPYGYEYQGNPQRLVYTPLTAKCYLTLCEGIALGYGGNPYGPAGTGKTESVKALGQALGRQVLVFNCDEAIDVQSMCRIFTGLVMGGAWGCFDEFNRLDEEVLSALSQQIQIIQTAILKKSPSLELMGRNIDVNPNAGIYVTLNPAGKGYGGRSKLPSNLTQLFRAVAMSAPDNVLIAEVLMYSEGFHCATQVSKQLVTVFKLCSQLLSPQKHYDWGLRSLKSVLSTAEQWLTQMLTQDQGKGEVHIDETALIVKAMRVATLSKLTFSDCKQFEQIIADVFPGVNLETVEAYELRTAISQVLQELKLVELPKQVEKMLQMWESVNQRTGVVITGPSGCGKTTLWTVLAKALAKIGVKVDIEVMNPKSMPRQRLLGRVDYDTREWFDGAITRAARRAVASPNRSWIVCDGDIDPEWIESLNSVLDDNRLLTLPNGERIQFDNRVNFVFESDSLEHASPATVSRMAVILLAPEDLTVQHICKSWIEKWPTDSRIKFYMDGLFYRTIESLKKKSSHFAIPQTIFGLVQNILSHLNHISGYNDVEFVNSLIRGAVAILEPNEQSVMANDIFKWASQVGLTLTGINSQNLLDQTWNSDNQCLQLFEFHPVPPEVPPLTSLALPLISIPEVQRTIATIKPWIESGESIMLVGARGSGKTCVLTHLFKILPSTSIITINCSAKTNADTLLAKLLQQCTIVSAASGQVLRPRSTEKALVFFKNFDLPQPDKWGTVQLVSFVHQLLSHGGFYNDELQWIKIEKIQFVFSMSSAEKRPISPRFTSLVRVASQHNTSPSQLITIYSQYLSVILKGTPLDDTGNIASIASAMIRVYESFKSKFSVDEYPLYDFTFRDITRWVVMLERYTHNSNTINPNLIVYEGLRHFVDRLASLNDRVRMTKEIKDIFHSLMPSYEESDIEYTNYQIESNDKQPLYLVQTDRNVAIQAFNKLIVSYEREMGHLGIFRNPDTEFLAHRISSLISLPGSNVVAITVPGLSFTDILKVICHTHGIEIYSPACPADFSYASFMAFLKDLIPKVIQKDEECILFIEDYMFVDNAILDALNSLMASGEVAGLFTQTEFDSLVASVQAELREVNNSSSKSQLTAQEFFCQKVMKMIHVIVALNYHSPSFKSYFSFAPSFISDAQIIWTTELSRESLAIVPRQILLESDSDPTIQAQKAKDKVDESLILSQETVTKITPLFVQIFQTVDEPPIRYVQFLELYKKIFGDKSSLLNGRKSHLDIGLAKLNDASQTVDTLSGEISAKKKDLGEKEAAATEAMKQIKEAMKSCSEQQVKIDAMTKEIRSKEEELQVKQSEIQAQLDTIQPKIDEAKKAVGQLDRKMLAEVKSAAKPPQGMSELMTGVITLLRSCSEDSSGTRGDLSWNEIKSMIGQKDFTSSILAFDIKNANAGRIAAAEKMVNDPSRREFFNEKFMSSKSAVCPPLCKWVHANLDYYHVLQNVGPLQASKKKNEAKINELKAEFGKLQKDKAKVDADVAKFQDNFKKYTQEAEKLKNEVRTAENNLRDANELFSKLKDERTRWDAQRNDIQQSVSKLPKEAIISAAIATFCGSFPEDERKQLIAKWLPIANLSSQKSDDDSENTFSLPKWMYSESELLDLRGCLGGDNLSIENAVIISNAQVVPLIIDPTNKALDWLTKFIQKESNGKIQATVLPRSHERFTSELALAVRFGKTLIITELDTIDGILLPLVRKELNYSGAHPTIRVGNDYLEYNEKFRLFLLTRDPQPELHPSASGHIITVNFSVTRAGLESMLLSLTLEKELPELQAERSKLINDEEETKIRLSKLEKELLDALVEDSGEDILHNSNLIETLNKTKAEAADAAIQLARLQSIAKSQEEKSKIYNNLSKLGASLYFSISSLSRLDHMYRFSSTLFLSLFASIFEGRPQKSSTSSTASLTTLNSINNSIQSQELRARKFESELIRVVFKHVSISLFNKHRPAAALHIIRSCYPSLVPENEYTLMLSESSSSGDAPSWIPEERRGAFTAFAQQRPDLVQSLKMRDSKFENTWREWVQQTAPEENWPLIEGQPITRRNVGPFTQLLLIAVLLPHRFISAVESFTKSNLQLDQFAQPFDFSQINAEKAGNLSNTPMIFIVSAGADPSVEIEATAKKAQIQLTEIATGQCTIEETLKLMHKAASEGSWLLIKNTHLSISLVCAIEKEFSALQSQPDRKPSFRLLLTTEPHSSFPELLLSSSTKIALEAPPGLRANLLRTVSSLRGMKMTKPQFSLTMAVAYFHAIIQERRTFNPQGWTKFYEFSSADFSCAQQIIGSLSTNKESSRNASEQFEYLRGLLGTAVYGGRVDNDFDFKVLELYLKQIIDEKFENPLKPDPNTTLDKALEHAQKMQERDSPAKFNLPPNATKTIALSKMGETIVGLRRLNAASGEDGGINRSEWVKRLRPLYEKWTQIKVAYPNISSRVQQEPADDSPMAAALFSQYCRVHELVDNVELFFNDLNAFLNKGAALSHLLIKNGKALMNNEVPEEWFDVAEGPVVASEWITELKRKVMSIDALAEQPKLVQQQKGIELSTVITPSAIFDALRQQTARETNTPIIDLHLNFGMGDERENGIFVNDLALQGAVMQGLKIAQMAGERPVTQKCPICCFSWGKKPESDRLVNIPLYSNSNREKCIISVPTPCQDDPAIFSFAGTAFILNPN